MKQFKEDELEKAFDQIQYDSFDLFPSLTRRCWIPHQIGDVYMFWNNNGYHIYDMYKQHYWQLVLLSTKD